MHRTSSILLASVVFLAACGSDDVPKTPHAAEEGVQEDVTISSAKRSVIRPGFPRTIGVNQEVLSALLRSSFTPVDPTVRALLTRAREPFRITLEDGTHTFAPRLKSMGLISADLRRDLVIVGDTQGNDAVEIIVVVEYWGDSLVASEVLVFSVEGRAVRQTASFVVGESEVLKVGTANRTIRIRVAKGDKELDMTFMPKE